MFQTIRKVFLPKKKKVFLYLEILCFVFYNYQKYFLFLNVFKDYKFNFNHFVDLY